MFRQTVRPLALAGNRELIAAEFPDALALMQARSRDLSVILDRWQRYVPGTAPNTGAQAFLPLTGPAQNSIGGLLPAAPWPPAPAPLAFQNVLRPHAIYAYLVENTLIVPMWRRVVEQFRTREGVVPSIPTQRWLEATQELFMSWDPPEPFRSPETRGSDNDATRRTLYYRLLGMDLNHEPEGSAGYAKPEQANRTFVNTLEELLRQVWIGHQNALNLVGVNVTDAGAIASLATQLYDMLLARRVGNTVDRDEFWACVMMEWLQLPLEWDSPIVNDLSANGPSASERMRKIGARVGVTVHARSRAYFELADDLSLLLRLIETNVFNAVAAVPALYLGPPVNLPVMVNRIITNWFAVTGRDLKAPVVAFERTARTAA